MLTQSQQQRDLVSEAVSMNRPTKAWELTGQTALEMGRRLELKTGGPV